MMTCLKNQGLRGFAIVLFLWAVAPNKVFALPPQDHIQIETKSNQQTFNHLQDFIIHEDQIWYRSRKTKSAWQAMPMPKGKSVPMQLRADGANFMYLDSRGRIHYKKVLEEKYSKKRYSAKDLAGKNNWDSQWFSFPIVRNVIGLFQLGKDKHLRLPEGVVSWSISHRGTFNHHFEDAKNRKHSEFSMVTTVYIIPQGGQSILYADPYLLGGFSHSIPWPNLDFIGEHIDSSSSTLLLVGQEKGIPTAYVSSGPFDFDTLGHNPFLPAFWRKSSGVPLIWKRIELPDFREGYYTSNQVSISQTEEGGNAARELRIEVNSPNSRSGFYSKMLNDHSWTFNVLDEIREEPNSIPSSFNEQHY